MIDIEIPDDLKAIEAESLFGADYGGFEIWDGKLVWLARWVGDAPGDEPQDTTNEVRRNAQELIEALGYEIGDTWQDHDTAYFYIFEKFIFYPRCKITNDFVPAVGQNSVLIENLGRDTLAPERACDIIPFDLQKEIAMPGLITPIEQVTPGYWFARKITKNHRDEAEKSSWLPVLVEGTVPFLRIATAYLVTSKDVDMIVHRERFSTEEEWEFGRRIGMPEDI